MITEYKVLGNLKTQIANLPVSENYNFRCIQQFSDFTETMITQGKLGIADKCFKLAEKAFTKGDDAIRAAMQNIFLNPLRFAITYNHCENLLPTALKSELQNMEVQSRIRRDNIDEY